MLRKIFWKGTATEWLAVSVWPKVLMGHSPCFSDPFYFYQIICSDWWKVLWLDKETFHLMSPSFFPKGIFPYINFLSFILFFPLSQRFIKTISYLISKKLQHYKAKNVYNSSDIYNTNIKQVLKFVQENNPPCEIPKLTDSEIKTSCVLGRSTWGCRLIFFHCYLLWELKV